MFGELSSSSPVPFPVLTRKRVFYDLHEVHLEQSAAQKLISRSSPLEGQSHLKVIVLWIGEVQLPLLCEVFRHQGVSALLK